jgi:hypothetical protein
LIGSKRRVDDDQGGVRNQSVHKRIPLQETSKEEVHNWWPILDIVKRFKRERKGAGVHSLFLVSSG